jgi:YceI-like domain
VTHITPAGLRVPAAGRSRPDLGYSIVTFRTRHLSGLGAVTEILAVVSGKATLNPAARYTTVTAAISAASFSSGNRARDHDVRSPRPWHAGHHPGITVPAGTLSPPLTAAFADGPAQRRALGWEAVLGVDHPPPRTGTLHNDPRQALEVLRWAR